MILNKILVRICSVTKKHYNNLGYFYKMKVEFEIPPEHLPNGSHHLVEVQCDICNKIKDKKIRYSDYYDNKKIGGKYCCPKCSLFKQEITNMENYGVKYYTQTNKSKIKSSNRMKKDNPMFNTNLIEKMVNTKLTKTQTGEIKFYNTKKYKDTNLYYQGSYEYDFLELCEKLDFIHFILNGNVYKYIDNLNHFRMLTDFSFGDYEIEIKSTYILNKQGGLDLIKMKKDNVESKGKKYILILDKNYSEIISIILDHLHNQSAATDAMNESGFAYTSNPLPFR